MTDVVEGHLSNAKRSTFGMLGPKDLYELLAPGAATRVCKDLLVYIHVPFCTSKCHFCDWVVGYDTADLVNRGDLMAQYVDALCKQIVTYAPMLREFGYRVTNIYWGGGTPTRLHPADMARILDVLSSELDLSSVNEHTAECSPETVTLDHLRVLTARGLNRASTGAQSYDATVLRKMGRAHGPEQIDLAVQCFRDAGLENFNIDLITGFPDQSAASTMESVQRAIDADIPHVTLYMFREFAERLVAKKQADSGDRVRRSSEERLETYFAAKALFESAGYEEYIFGYFAKSPRFQFDCEDYYFSLRGDYFGFGAGAGSILGRCTLKSGDITSFSNAQVRAFIADPLVMNAARLEMRHPESILMYVFLDFGTKEGINYARWEDLFGFSFQDFVEANPGVRHWFAAEIASGAEFIKSDTGIALSASTRLPTLMRWTEAQSGTNG